MTINIPDQVKVGEEFKMVFDYVPPPLRASTTALLSRTTPTPPTASLLTTRAPSLPLASLDPATPPAASPPSAWLAATAWLSATSTLMRTARTSSVGDPRRLR
ncbi:MAG: hypothetical protein U1U88_001312 [Lawsonella clevelandensis]